KHRRRRHRGHQGEHEPEGHGVKFISLIRLSGGEPAIGRQPSRSADHGGVTSRPPSNRNGPLPAAAPRVKGDQGGQALAAALRSFAALAATSAALVRSKAYSWPNTLAQNRTAASTWDCRNGRSDSPDWRRLSSSARVPVSRYCCTSLKVRSVISLM